MTDRYERIRAALAMGPTPGPWRCEHETGGGHDCWMIYASGWPRSGGIVGYYTHTGPRHIPHVRPNIEAVAIAHHIVACDPDTIRALLAERDALARDAARYRWLSAMATQQADHLGPIFRIDVRRSEPYLFNFDAAIDAAMQRTNAREGEQ